MTAEEWQNTDNLAEMLDCLRPGRRARPSERKFRLFACACCRQIWHLLDVEGQYVVEAAERFADGLMDKTAMRMAGARAEHAGHIRWKQRQDWREGRLALTQAQAVTMAAEWPLVTSRVANAAACAAVLSHRMVNSAAEVNAALPEFQKGQCLLLRDVIGNPFCPRVYSPTWRTSNVVTLAWEVYEERVLPSGHLAEPRLALLACALADAGCADAEMLNHCRAPGVHVRGCWVVDVILEKA